MPDIKRRITVIVSEELHRKARLKAAETDKPVSEVVREALERWTANENEGET